ncbi:1522_t:CDS:2, partial [Diversispora eburnea]
SIGNSATAPVLVQNITSTQNSAPAPEGDHISEENVSAVDLLTEDIPDIKVEPSSNNQGEQKKKSILTIDEIIKWLSKPEIKNNKKIRSKPMSKTDEEWFDLMETDDDKDSEPSDSEYDTADEDPEITETEKFNEGKVCDYYAFVSKEYYAEGEPLGFFESIEKKIANVYKRELGLKEGLKHETIKIIKEDRINTTIEKEYNEIIDEIKDEVLQESEWSLSEQKRAETNTS